MSHIPTYVFFIFAALVWIGVKRMSPREVTPERLLVMPAIFAGLGLHGFLGIFPQAGLTALIGAGIGALAGLGAGWLQGARYTLGFDPQSRRIAMPGDPLMLGLILAIFAFEFVLHAAATTRAPWLANAFTPPLAAAIWAALAAISAGRNLNIARRYNDPQRSNVAKTGA